MSPGRGESWRGMDVGYKYFCGNGVNHFLRYISYETQMPQAPMDENKYRKYHIIYSEASSCEE